MQPSYVKKNIFASSIASVKKQIRKCCIQKYFHLVTPRRRNILLRTSQYMLNAERQLLESKKPHKVYEDFWPQLIPSQYHLIQKSNDT